MTREEAMYLLNNLRSIAEGKEDEAIDMAIEALSEPTCKKCTDLISRKEASKAIEAETTEAWTESDADFNRGMDMAKSIVESLPSAEPKTDEEDELKFYYVESIDDYWIGARLDNFYYADWHEGLGFVWSHSRYLPWGEHIVDENTLWKEHTYPSEPIEIPFTEWIVGFVKKYFTEPRTPCKTCGYYNLECPKNCEYGRPSADIISREDAIKAIESRQTEQWIDADVDYNNGLESAVAEIKALPSADRPSGEWVEKEVMVDEDANITEWQSAKCSVCGKYHTTPYMYYFDNFNHCPNCGAKMGSDTR